MRILSSEALQRCLPVFYWLLRKRSLLLPLPPVVFNGLIVGSYVYLLYDKTYPWLLTMLFIAISEALVCYGLGLPLLSMIKKTGLSVRFGHIH